ncbi:MAG: AsmA family protein, partial [Kiloniellales bacterium]
MKKLGFGLLGLFGLLVAAVAIGPSFVDWNAQKGRIAAEARKLTGRDLVIDGDVSLTLLPAPALSVAGVKLANIAGGSDPTMVALESLKVRIAFLPLLQFTVKVESIDLVKPTILLEVLPDGRRNWEISPPAEAAPPPPGDRTETGDLPDAVRLDSITITDGTLIYRDALSGRDERIDQVNVEIAAQTLQGPFAISGSAVARGLAGEFEIGLGRLVDDGATSFKLRAGLLDGAATIRFGGAISVHPEGTSLRGQISADGDNLAALVQGFTGNPRPASALAMPFSLAAELSADSQLVSASGLVLRLGDSALDGAIQVSLGPPADARITLSATRLDLDALLAQDATGGAPAPSTEGAEKTPAAAGPADELSLPQDMTGSLELAVEALAYRGQVVRQIRLGVALAEGRIRITQALALLPGGSDISVSGTLQPGADGRAGHRFDGRIEAASDNLRAVLDWLGAEVAAVPAERLRRMSLSAHIGATARQVTVSEIDLRLDLSRVTGGVVVALRDRPGLGIGLAVDKMDLDAYLPAVAKETTAAGPGTDGAPPRPSASAPFDAFDANLDLKIGRLTLAGMVARDLRLDAVLQQGALT